MTEFKSLTLTHANLKRPVKVRLGSIGPYHDAHNELNTRIHTNLYTNAGIVPVVETPDEIERLIDELTKGDNK